MYSQLQIWSICGKEEKVKLLELLLEYHDVFTLNDRELRYCIIITSFLHVCLRMVLRENYNASRYVFTWSMFSCAMEHISFV